MTAREAIELLQATGKYEIFDKHSGHRIKCFLCGQWQKDSLTRGFMFNGIEERICVSCRHAILARETDLEQFLGDNDEA